MMTPKTAMRVIVVPIEPLVERYSESWYRNIPEYFRSQNCEVVQIDGQPLTNVVETGTFLDINSTVAYKASQMQAIATMFYEGRIQDGDVFFISDIEFWGIEALRLLADMNKKKVFITGFLHAASYTLEDAFEIASPYQKYTELGWLMACDYVFVGSMYHKKAVIERRIEAYAAEEDQRTLIEKIKVTGNPLFIDDYTPYPKVPKLKKLVISNRFDYEKRPNLSLDFAYLLKKRNPDLEIAVTTSRPKFTSNRSWLVDYARALEADGILTVYEGLSKAAYHRHLAESSLFLTNSIEENFGYCVIEACLYGAVPLAPRTCSHPELLGNNDLLLFSNEDEILSKAEYILNTTLPVPVEQYAKRYYSSMDSIFHFLQLTQP